MHVVSDDSRPRLIYDDLSPVGDDLSRDAEAQAIAGGWTDRSQ
jgi:hypothetical protein